MTSGLDLPGAGPANKRWAVTVAVAAIAVGAAFGSGVVLAGAHMALNSPLIGSWF